MRTLFSLLLVFAVTAACQSDVYQRGKGPVTLSPKTLASFEKYKTENSPSYFALANDGKGALYTICPLNLYRCKDDFGVKARRSCEDRAKVRGSECSIFAVGRTIIWDGPVTYPKPRAGYLFSFAKIRPDGESFFTGQGNGRDGGHRIELRLRECRGEADLKSGKWHIKGCKDNYAAQGTLSQGSGNEKFYGVGRDSQGNGVEFKLFGSGPLKDGAREYDGTLEMASDSQNECPLTAHSNRNACFGLEYDKPAIGEPAEVVPVN